MKIRVDVICLFLQLSRGRLLPFPLRFAYAETSCTCLGRSPRGKAAKGVPGKHRLNFQCLKDFLESSLTDSAEGVTAIVPPKVKHQDLFLRLQREAREAGRGLWR